MSRLLARLIVFFTSASVLVIEILAARILAPYVGVSLETFTGIIGVILAGLVFVGLVGLLYLRIDVVMLLGLHDVELVPLRVGHGDVRDRARLADQHPPRRRPGFQP